VPFDDTKENGLGEPVNRQNIFFIKRTVRRQMILWETSTTYDDAEEEGVTECLFGVLRMKRPTKAVQWALRCVLHSNTSE